MIAAAALVVALSTPSPDPPPCPATKTTPCVYLPSWPSCGVGQRTIAGDETGVLCYPANEPLPPCRTHEQAALALIQQSIAHGTAALSAKTKAQGDHEAALQRIDAAAARLQQQAYAGCKK